MDIRVRLDEAANQWVATSDNLPGVECRGDTAEEAVTNAAKLLGRLRAADAVPIPMAAPAVLAYKTPDALRPLPPRPPPLPPITVVDDDPTGGLARLATGLMWAFGFVLSLLGLVLLLFVLLR